MFAAEDLGKRFDRRWVLRHITFELVKGDGLAVLGRNGSGKSTLLRLLAELEIPTEGSVRMVPEPTLNLGYSALEQKLYPNLTVREHLEFAGSIRSIEPRSDELLDRIGLAHAAKTMGRALSTGMRSRVRLALAIQSRPQVLLLDEPGAALDELGQELVASICKEQLERGVLILATNDQEERRLTNLELKLEG